VVSLLVLVVAGAGALAWTAIGADRAQRAAAEATVADYADFAAFILASETEARLRQAFLYSYYREDLAWERSGALMPPAGFAADLQEMGRCAEAYADGERWFARLDLPGRELALEGAPGAAVSAWLADTLPALVAAEAPDHPEAGHVIEVVDGERRVVSYRVRRDGASAEPLAVYALSSCFRDRDGPVVASAMAAGPILPPSLVGEAPADSLVSVRFIDPLGGVLFQNASTFRSGYVGRAELPGAGVFGGATLEVTLRPDVAEKLVRGGLPLASRAPVAIVLLLATIGLVVVAATLLVRSIRLVRLRERFVADVSHELRTPLQQVLLFSQLLRIGQVRNAEERSRFLAIIEREALRLIALVERVMEFARSRTGVRGASDDDVADVGQVLRDTVTGLEPLLAERSARVSLRLADDARALAAPDAVHQIALNLLDNALKYGPSGQVISVRVDVGSVVTLEVGDRGPGIPVEDRERIWEPFYRLERESREARSGSGIGLAVVRELADRSGATVDVRDGESGGAVFRVRFRRAQVNPPASPTGAAGRSDAEETFARSTVGAP
jgi:signal transduction histidine kinase